MVIIDAVTRLIPGNLGNEGSADEDSFSAGLLEYPQYTRPRSFRNKEVPDVLVSGDHGAIRKWRRRESILRTLLKRPDLLETASLATEDRLFLEMLRREIDTVLSEPQRCKS
jgi:tRNA (guanine37-N1)-methyltransferase